MHTYKTLSEATGLTEVNLRQYAFLKQLPEPDARAGNSPIWNDNNPAIQQFIRDHKKDEATA
ncbi:hypothetical protein SEA_WALTZ_75 [Arthrobacter phage Waltz]|nr:hypothetical protein SEA_WALTZ_75 [Arthrobacter phage Waltz]